MFPNAILKKSMIGFDKPDDALILFDKMLNMRPLPIVIDFSQLLAALVMIKDH